ncbi:hypothetical protein D7X75_07825 [Corallococcus sp. CA031C]|nr:hypothetical protein D7X75_07825 [Corallococcus sp. CA031C]
MRSLPRRPLKEGRERTELAAYLVGAAYNLARMARLAAAWAPSARRLPPKTRLRAKATRGLASCPQTGLLQRPVGAEERATGDDMWARTTAGRDTPSGPCR